MTGTPHFPTMSAALLSFSDPIDGIHRIGKQQAPRGIETREVLGAAFTIGNAVMAGLPVKIGRKVSMALAAIEGAQNLAGEGFPQLAIDVAPALVKFADHDGSGRPFFHGSYSNRLGFQLPRVEQQLRDDSLSRQAVVSMWDESDRDPRWRDRPCATELQFLLRDGYLELLVYMRSNDVWKGFSYDVFQFGQLQAALANVLGVTWGEYYHFAASFHVYDSDLERFAALKPEDGNGDTAPWIPSAMRSGPGWDLLPRNAYKSMTEVQQTFKSLLIALDRRENFETANVVEEWYFITLANALKKNGVW